MLAAARKKLDAAGVRYQAHVLVGPVAEAIVKHANDKRCDLIYIGTHAAARSARRSSAPPRPRSCTSRTSRSCW